MHKTWIVAKVFQNLAVPWCTPQPQKIVLFLCEWMDNRNNGGSQVIMTNQQIILVCHPLSICVLEEDVFPQCLRIYGLSAFLVKVCEWMNVINSVKCFGLLKLPKKSVYHSLPLSCWSSSVSLLEHGRRMSSSSSSSRLLHSFCF